MLQYRHGLPTARILVDSRSQTRLGTPVLETPFRGAYPRLNTGRETEFRKSAFPNRVWEREGQSRRRHGQQLFVLRAILRPIVAGRRQRQIVVHLVARENLAELRDEQPLAQMPRELLQVLHVVGRRAPSTASG